jgi:hypothetical protein
MPNLDQQGRYTTPSSKSKKLNPRSSTSKRERSHQREELDHGGVTTQTNTMPRHHEDPHEVLSINLTPNDIDTRQ